MDFRIRQIPLDSLPNPAYILSMPSTQLTTLRALVTFGALRSSDEIAVAVRGIRSRSRRGYSRALRTLLASGTLRPAQVAVVAQVIA